MRIHLTLLVFLISGTSAAQEWRYPVQTDAGVRLINSAGELVGDDTFVEARAFAGGLGAARQDVLWGYVDAAGDWAIDPVYQEADDFQDGRARVRAQDGWILIDESGRQVTRTAYAEMTPLGDGLAAYQEMSESRRRPGKWGILSSDGVELSRPELDGAATPGDGLIPAQRFRRLLFLRLERRWGFVDSRGVWAIEPRFTSVRQYSEGLGMVSDGKRARYLTTSGDTLLTVEYPAAHAFHEGLARVGTPTVWGYINTDGVEVIAPQYEAATDFSEGRAAVRKGGRWGYIDATGAEVVPFRFQIARSFQGPLARVVDGGVERYIDQSGRIVWPRP